MLYSNGGTIVLYSNGGIIVLYSNGGTIVLYLKECVLLSVCTFSYHSGVSVVS